MSRERQSSSRGEVIPFWFWNDRLESSRIDRQLEDINMHGVNEVIIHPRHGLPEGVYLSPQWFNHVRNVVEAAADRGMKVWLYDELNWPSGTAGGRITRENPAYTAKCIAPRNGELRITMSEFRIAYNTAPPLDVLNPAAVQRFILETHARYEDAVGDHFGNTVQGFFTDEPGMYANLFGGLNPGTLPYTDDMFVEFQRDHHYNPLDHMSRIWTEEGADSRTIRLHYFQTLTRLYTERYLGRIANYCHQRGLKLIGHVLEEENPLGGVKSQGDPFKAGAMFDWPGFDVITGLSPQHAMSAEVASTTARMHDRPEVVAEAFGAFGRKMGTNDMLETARRLAQRGATVLVPHGLQYSSRGSRPYESPPNLMGPGYWNWFAGMVEEFQNTVESVQSAQRPPADICIYYPVQAIQGMYNPANPHRAMEISQTIVDTTLDVDSSGERFRYETDDSLVAGLQVCRLIRVPAADIMPLESLIALRDLARRGVEIECIGSAPRYAADASQQTDFEAVLREFDPLVVSHEAAVSAGSARAQRLQYKVWHGASSISPRLAESIKDAKGLATRAARSIRR